MAWSALKLSSCRWILYNFLASAARCCTSWIAKESRLVGVSAGGDWRSGFGFHRVGWIPGVTFDSIRFRQLYQSLARTPVFHVWQIDWRRDDSVRVILHLRDRVAVPPVQSGSASSGARYYPDIYRSFRNRCEP